MKFPALERFEAEKAARDAEQQRLDEEVALGKREKEAKRALRAAVSEELSKKVVIGRKPAGRAPIGGLSKKLLGELRAKAARYLDKNNPDGIRELETEIQHTALLSMLIDGQLGTEPWRSQGPHGGAVSAAARVRYLETATRLLTDLKNSRGDSQKLLAGVIDAELADKQ